LTKTEYKKFPYFEEKHFYGGSDTEISNDTIDPQEATAVSSETFAKFEYHIVYSISYSVPVLYFNVNRPGMTTNY
jgi:hypothetical protein